jgi:hypothetical protein
MQRRRFAPTVEPLPPTATLRHSSPNSDSNAYRRWWRIWATETYRYRHDTEPRPGVGGPTAAQTQPRRIPPASNTMWRGRGHHQRVQASHPGHPFGTDRRLGWDPASAAISFSLRSSFRSARWRCPGSRLACHAAPGYGQEVRRLLYLYTWNRVGANKSEAMKAGSVYCRGADHVSLLSREEDRSDERGPRYSDCVRRWSVETSERGPNVCARAGWETTRWGPADRGTRARGHQVSWATQKEQDGLSWGKFSPGKSSSFSFLISIFPFLFQIQIKPSLNSKFTFMHKQNSSMGCKYNFIYLYPTYLNRCSHLWKLGKWFTSIIKEPIMTFFINLSKTINFNHIKWCLLFT